MEILDIFHQALKQDVAIHANEIKYRVFAERFEVGGIFIVNNYCQLKHSIELFYWC